MECCRLVVTLCSSPAYPSDMLPTPLTGPVSRYGSPLWRVAEAVATVSEAGWSDIAGATCRALVDLLELDEARYITPSGQLGCWDRDPRQHRPRIRRHCVQTAVSDAGERPLQWRDGGYSLLALPVRRSGRRAAVLVGGVRGDREFDPDELQAGMLVAAAAAAGALEPPRETTELGLESWELEHGGSEVDMAAVLLDSLTQVLPSDACCLYGLIHETNRVVPLHWAGDEVGGRPGRVVSPGVGSAGAAMLDGRPRIIESARRDRHASRLLPSAADESGLVLPVLVDGAPVVVAVCARVGVGRFSADDLQKAQRVARRSSASFRVALARSAAEREASISRTLLDLGDALNGRVDSVGSLAQLVAASTRRLAPASQVSVWLRRGRKFDYAAGAGFSPAEIERLRVAQLATDDPVVRYALDRRAVCLRDLDVSSAYAQVLDGELRAPRVAVVPIGERAANRAVLLVQRGPTGFAESDVRILQGIADQALIGLTNRQLYDDLEESFLATVKALATALATNDEYTGEHACELEGLCTTVGQALGLESAELRDVGLAAALHDIGKIGIPSPILRKPAALTPEEQQVMRRHPEMGARIIAPVAALDGARELVIACHEHWDGSGYPFGLSGEQIPLGARIILVCDAYHAMTSNRVYRQALPKAEVLRELERCSGTQFDPVVADALLDLVR